MSCISELKVRQPKQQHNYTRALIKNASHLKHMSRHLTCAEVLKKGNDNNSPYKKYKNHNDTDYT